MSKPKNESFIRLDHDLVRGEAWAGLSANATRLLIGIWNQHNGYNNGDLRFGHAQAKQLLRCSARTASRTFRELEDAGLIEAVEKGSFAHKASARKGMVTAWRINAIEPSGKPGARRPRDSFNGAPDGCPDGT